MRILITGSSGQLGRALVARLPDAEIYRCDMPECDITNPRQMRQMARTIQPDIVLHCAALTDVDGCARDPALAFRVNGMGTQNVALACAEADAALLYVSTNEVFAGTASEPYSEFAATNPINAYGRSKLAGEWYAQHLLRRFYVVRTSWLYAPGGANFIHQITQRAAEGLPLRVVDDEVAAPTLVSDLVEAIAALIQTECYGIYHLTNAGYCSRYDWACKALELAGLQVPVERIRRADFPRPSTPPAFTPLANQAAAALGIALRPWEEALADFIRVKERVSTSA